MWSSGLVDYGRLGMHPILFHSSDHLPGPGICPAETRAGRFTVNPVFRARRNGKTSLGWSSLGGGLAKEGFFGRPWGTDDHRNVILVIRGARTGKVSLGCSSVGGGRPSERYFGHPPGVEDQNRPVLPSAVPAGGILSLGWRPLF